MPARWFDSTYQTSLGKQLNLKFCLGRSQQRQKNQICNSSYTTFCDKPTSIRPTYGKSLFLKRTRKRKIKPFVFSLLIHGADRKRFDILMMEKCRNAFPSLMKGLFHVWDCGIRASRQLGRKHKGNLHWSR